MKYIYIYYKHQHCVTIHVGIFSYINEFTHQHVKIQYK